MNKRKINKIIYTILFFVIIFAFFLGIVKGKVKDTFFKETVSKGTVIDWQLQYPFTNQETQSVKKITTEKNQGILDQYQEIFSNAKSAVNYYCTQYIIGRQRLLEINGYINRFLGKQVIEGVDDSIVQLNNGYLIETEKAYSNAYLAKCADAITGLSDYVKSKGAKFMYVQLPNKLCKYDEQLPVGADSYVNQNFDGLLKHLSENKVAAFDLREAIHKNGLNHYELFYVTDNHWKVSTGLWAARQLSNYVTDELGLPMNSAILSEENFRNKTYPKDFLGYYGRRVTLGFADPEDFTVPLPMWDTDITVTCPGYEIDNRGKFEDVMYQKGIWGTKDYYNTSDYEAQLFGNKPVHRIINHQIENGLKVLIIRDSFSLSVAPYLALNTSEIDMVDLRSTQGNFNGNLKAFIDEGNYDVVIMMCFPENDVLNRIVKAAF